MSDCYLTNYHKEYCVIYTEIFNTSITFDGNRVEKTTQHTITPTLYFGNKKECLEFCNKKEKNTYIQKLDYTLIDVLGVFNVFEDFAEKLFLDFKKHE